MYDPPAGFIGEIVKDLNEEKNRPQTVHIQNSADTGHEADCILPGSTAGPQGLCPQRLIQIGQNIVDILDADREADATVGDADLLAFDGGQVAM